MRGVGSRAALAAALACLALAVVVHGKDAALEPAEAVAAGVDETYPPKPGSDVLKLVYKLDPAVAEEFDAQRKDLAAQLREVSSLAASLRKEKERIVREYPDARSELFAGNASAASVYTVNVGDDLVSIAHQHGVTVEQLYTANREAVNRDGVKPHMQLHVPVAAPRPAVVAASALATCRKHVEHIAAGAERCATDLSAKITELVEARRVASLAQQRLEDAKKGDDAMAAMQKTIAELRSAKSL